MCTRYYMELSPELRPFIDRAARSSILDNMMNKLARPLKTEGEIRPTDMVPVVAPDARNRQPTVFPMVWGFTNPGGGSPVVNCRVETASEKPFWKEAWKRRRCVIPASYYFEWEHLRSPDGKVKAGSKYMIQPVGCPVTYMAGLYQIEEQRGIKYPVFAILTREPGENIRFIHDRMPVILSKNNVKIWLNGGENEPSALTDMYFEKVSTN